MREIKFRAWDKEENKMYECVSVPCDKKDKWPILVYTSDHIINGIDHKNYELMQYTGSKDKNDKEIYEGDILLYTHEAVGQIKRQVVFQYGSYGIEGRVEGTHVIFANILEAEREVIGNIYENKDLLK